MFCNYLKIIPFILGTLGLCSKRTSCFVESVSFFRCVQFAKRFNEYAVTATDGLGIEQCLEQAICPGSQYSYLRATRTRADADTIPHYNALRKTYIQKVLDIFGLGDEDEPRLG